MTITLGGKTADDFKADCSIGYAASVWQKGVGLLEQMQDRHRLAMKMADWLRDNRKVDDYTHRDRKRNAVCEERRSATCRFQEVASQFFVATDNCPSSALEQIHPFAVHRAMGLYELSKQYAPSWTYGDECEFWLDDLCLPW